MSIISFLLFFVIAILLFVVVFVLSFVLRAWYTVRSFFGKGNTRKTNNPYGGQWEEPQGKDDSKPYITGGKPRSSEIDKNEGEYVDYEVID